ncbi:hypothetical protein Tco_0001291 [Tanacetum coccineum]
MWFCFGDNLCAYDYYVNIMWYDCACMHRGAWQGAYDLGVATPRALVYVGLMTNGDARSWYMISGDAKCGLLQGLLDIGSSGVDVPPVMQEDPYAYVVAAFQAPPSPDYVSGPEYPPSPDFVPELVYPEFMPPEDEVLPAEEQPLPAAVSHIADSPGYVPESDPKEDPEEDDDEDPKEDPDDYPTNGGDDSDDEDESSDDDEDDDVDIERMRRRRSTQLMPTLQLLLYQLISIRDKPHTLFWSDTEVARLLAIPTPPPSPLSLWSSPLPQIPSPPLPISPLPLPVSPTYPLGYTSAIDPARAEALYIH